jgi:sugar/nucleoside kinase (ribokinase family)
MYNGKLKGSQHQLTRMDNTQVVGHRFWGVVNRMTWLIMARCQLHENKGARWAFEERKRRGNGAVAMVMVKRQGCDSVWLLKLSQKRQGQWLKLKSDQRHVDVDHIVQTEHTQGVCMAQGVHTVQR